MKLSLLEVWAAYKAHDITVLKLGNDYRKRVRDEERRVYQLLHVYEKQVLINESQF
jgi:hypothetical protein